MNILERWRFEVVTTGHTYNQSSRCSAESKYHKILARVSVSHESFFLSSVKKMSLSFSTTTIAWTWGSAKLRSNDTQSMRWICLFNNFIKLNQKNLSSIFCQLGKPSTHTLVNQKIRFVPLKLDHYWGTFRKECFFPRPREMSSNRRKVAQYLDHFDPHNGLI